MEEQPISCNTAEFMVSPLLNKKILSLYSRGLSIAEIQDHLNKAYQIDMPLPVVSVAADAVHDEYRSWQNSALDDIYPIVYFDNMYVKFRENTTCRNQSVMFAVGIDMDGNKRPLGLWTAPNQDNNAWLQVIRSLTQRGVNDILIACVYGKYGAASALNTVLPQTETQLCIVRLVDHALNFVNWKERKTVAAALRAVYTADNADLGVRTLQSFTDNWDSRYPLIGQIWSAHWHELAPFFAQPAPVREAIYSTNAIQSLHRALSKITRRHGPFTDANDLLIRLYLAETHLTQRWGRPMRHWKNTLNNLAARYGRRIGY